MSRNSLKITTLAATVAASFGANAALYNVYMSAPEGTSSSLQTYGVAVSDEATSCWSASCDASTSELAVEVKRYREGFQYRDEAPFFLPFGWSYLDDGYDGFRSYCRNFLGYQTTQCDLWADFQYTKGYKNEIDGNYAGSIAYLDGGSELFAENTVVNSINSAFPTGNRRDGATYRNRAFTSVNGTSTIDLSLDDVGLTHVTHDQSHSWKTLKDGTDYYTVGSVTKSYDSASNNSYAAVWKNNDLQEPISWFGNNKTNGDRRAHGSARDIVKIGSDFYAVGYNSDSDVYFRATVFKSNDAVTWSSTPVSGFPYDRSEYANQTLQAVNNNKIAIGTAKLNRPLNGSYSNTLFYVDNIDSPSYKAFSGGIFFSGANGKAGSINNHDEVVGTIDYDRHSETNGNPRGKRAFIAPLTANAKAPLQGKAWYLDDLTYGSNATTDNNEFRIIEAADINDAGVIAATAYYCAGGWDSEAFNAACRAGASLVAVELVPIQGATSISKRPVEQSTIERQGGTLGLLALTLLGLLGLRRK
ncbi:DUF3466 family protein [Vibrio salilacus]|uniref:DUF3466 family protein n=1 Tax=Vibrio salilacus TaxID=1323749 RepID=UPI000C2A5C9C|nr:DUF3466 family protein [Vibrio salilacus]